MQFSTLTVLAFAASMASAQTVDTCAVTYTPSRGATSEVYTCAAASCATVKPTVPKSIRCGSDPGLTMSCACPNDGCGNIYVSAFAENCSNTL